MTILPNNLDGVTGIELISQVNGNTQFYYRVQKSINCAMSLRASVAYLTINPDFFNGSKLCSILHNGFLCVDIHLPTDINQLIQFAENQANIYLHLRNLKGTTETENRGISRHLLHTKMLLFDIDAENAEIWIGSHNWTKRALWDVNIEASLILRVTTNSSIYNSTVQLLESIKKGCDEFDPKNADYYRWLQNIPYTKPVIEMEGMSANNIGSEIMIFFTSTKDDTDLNKQGDRVYISVIDSDNHKEFIYKAEIKSRIESSSNIDSIFKDITQKKHRFAFRNENQLLKLQLPLGNDHNIDKSQILSTRFCLTLEIKPTLNGQILEPTEATSWNNIDNEYIYQSQSSEMINVSDFQVKKPASLEQFKQGGSKNLTDKRNTKFKSIINRKIVVEIEE